MAGKICGACGSTKGAVGFGCVEFIICGFIVGVSFVAGLVLHPFAWLIGFLILVAYALVVDGRAKQCKECGQKALIPLDSPKGREMAAAGKN